MPLRGDEYDARFARLAAEGQYMHGEADFVAGLLGDPPATVLDAGCGTGRVAIELARQKAPHIEWALVDLAAADLATGTYDLVVAAGNVMLFLELGTEAAVVANLAAALVPGGLLVAGFQVGRQLTLARYDALAADAGLGPVSRFATWERAAYAGGDYAVSVHRRPSRAEGQDAARARARQNAPSLGRDHAAATTTGAT